MIDCLRDPAGELRRIVKSSLYRRHRAVCLLVLAGTADDGEGHAVENVAELEHALSIDHTFLKMLMLPWNDHKASPAKPIVRTIVPRTVSLPRSFPLRSTSTRSMMSGSPPGFLGGRGVEGGGLGSGIS